MKDGLLDYLEKYWHVFAGLCMGLVSLIRMMFRVKSNAQELREFKQEVNQKFKLFESQLNQTKHDLQMMSRR